MLPRARIVNGIKKLGQDFFPALSMPSSSVCFQLATVASLTSYSNSTLYILPWCRLHDAAPNPTLDVTIDPCVMLQPWAAFLVRGCWQQLTCRLCRLLSAPELASYVDCSGKFGEDIRIDNSPEARCMCLSTNLSGFKNASRLRNNTHHNLFKRPLKLHTSVYIFSYQSHLPVLHVDNGSNREWPESVINRTKVAQR
jgi:hypothetical protein